MQATGTTLTRYLPMFRDRQADLLARGEASGHPADMATTLGLALSRLTGESPAAAGLVRLLAFMAPEPVPLALLLADDQAAGLLCPDSGSYPGARDLFGLIADGHSGDDAYGPEHPATLAARYYLAYWTGEAGDAAGARDQLAALLPIREQVQGAEHRDTLNARDNLAYWTRQAG
jgi:hypothetical protein